MRQGQGASHFQSSLELSREQVTNVVRLLCDRIMVMQNGEVVEEGDAGRLLDAPATDYTRTLLAEVGQGILGRARLNADEQSAYG